MTTNHQNTRSGDLFVLDGGVSDRSRPAQQSSPIRVLLADSVALVRAGFRMLLEGETNITVTGEAASGEQAVALARETRPDVILMDIHLSGLDGVEATRRILADPGPAQIKVLILTQHERDEELFGALRAGASGFLLKDTEPVELLRAVRVVAGGGAELSPAIARRLIDEFNAMPDPRRPAPELLDVLTAREREVMSLVAMGLTNDQIAQRLVVSSATAKTHVSRTMLKLHARDRANLVALAYQSGFVQPRLPRVDKGEAHNGGFRMPAAVRAHA
jgi:DNA-binding NarL/FixJ family response regulator